MALGAPPSLTEVPGGSSTATPLLCAEPVPSGHSGGACPERGAAAGKFEATIVGSFFTEICDDSHSSVSGATANVPATAHNLSPPLTSCMISGTLPDFTGPQFARLQYENNNPYLMEENNTKC